MRSTALLTAAVALLFALPLSASEITRDAIVAAMNACRTKAGVAPLREEPRLEAAAEDRMTDMEDQGYWGHESPQGTSPFVWLRPHGYEYRFAGENLATGFDTTELLLQGWMESPGHRENILSPDYSDCGIAIIDGGTVGPKDGKSVVVLFGTAKNPNLVTPTAAKSGSVSRP